MPSEYDVLVAGTGIAAANLAIALRQKGFTGSIALVGGEAVLPYDRTALSKDYLTGRRPAERLELRSGSFWRQQQVAVLGGSPVVHVDVPARRVQTADAALLGYRRLVWAAGARARRLALPDDDASGIHSVRSMADVDLLRAQLPAARRVVIVGAGLIGLEVAPGLLETGKSVTFIESAACVLPRAAPVLSAFIEAQHTRHGAQFRFGTRVEAVLTQQGRVSGLRITGGEVLPCDAVIVAVGAEPVVGPLQQAAVAVSGGIVVDEFCRTSQDGIHAIGDCAVHASRFAEGKLVRIESVQNAADQARVAAADLVGAAEPYRAVPWSWSHQHEIRLQCVGLSLGHERAILRGDPDTGSFSVVYLRAGRVVALDCVNAMRDFTQGKVLVEAGAAVAESLLSDPGVPLNAHLASVATPA